MSFPTVATRSAKFDTGAVTVGTGHAAAGPAFSDHRLSKVLANVDIG